MTNETKQQILEAYADKSIKTREIVKKYHVSNRSLTAILKEAGVEQRRPRKNFKKCPKCHRAVEKNNANFCYFCGADIRSEGDILITRLQSLLGMLQPLTGSGRDEARDIINDTIKYVRMKK